MPLYISWMLIFRSIVDPSFPLSSLAKFLFPKNKGSVYVLRERFKKRLKFFIRIFSIPIVIRQDHSLGKRRSAAVEKRPHQKKESRNDEAAIISLCMVAARKGGLGVYPVRPK